MYRETVEQRAERYLRENRSVSGGKDNPPDRYALVKLTGNEEIDQASMNVFSDQGFRVVENLPVLPFDYLLMGNYKENK